MFAKRIYIYAYFIYFDTITRIYLSLNQIDILILIRVRADEFAVEFRTGGVDAACSRGDNFFTLGQVEVRRRQDLAPR